MNATPGPASQFEESSVNILSFLTFLISLTLGLLAAVLVLPTWLPNIAFSLGSDSPKAYWYLSRGTAFISLTLLWISMMLGVGLSNKLARLWPGAAAAFAVHEYVSLLGIAFAIFHAVVLLGDKWINLTLMQLLVPFSTVDYRPLWVGTGQIAFYLWLIVAFTFYVRKLIGQQTWRLIHYASFLMYLLGLSHGLFGGTDSSLPWVQYYYWATGGSLLFLFFTRLVGSIVDGLFPKPKLTPSMK